ncbi:unnamed protein product [Withania somnifera]
METRVPKAISSTRPNPKTFSIITERYFSVDKAVNVFLSMHKHGCPQDLSSFNAFIDVFCKLKRAEMANKLFKMFGSKFKVDTISYNTLANGFCLIKRTPKAQELLKEMVERGLNPTITTYNIMLNGFFRAEQIREAWEFFLQMKKRKCDIDVVTYTTMKAQKLFKEMVGAGLFPSVATYNALIQVMCKKDSVENAILVFDEMLRKGYLPNATTYNVIIRVLCHVGKMDNAMEYRDKMKEDGCEPNVQPYNVVIRYYCDEGEIGKGLRVGFLPRKFTFNRILNGLLLTGNQDFAKEILRLGSKSGIFPAILNCEHNSIGMIPN